MRELPVPANVVEDLSAKEILRVWSSAGSQSFACVPRVWGDPAAWGLLLVDIARQIAGGFARDGDDPAVVLGESKPGSMRNGRRLRSSPLAQCVLDGI